MERGVQGSFEPPIGALDVVSLRFVVHARPRGAARSGHGTLSAVAEAIRQLPISSVGFACCFRGGVPASVVVDKTPPRARVERSIRCGTYGTDGRQSSSAL